LSEYDIQWFLTFYAGNKQEFWQAAQRRSRALKLRPPIEDKLEAFAETIPADAIGVHIRRSDHEHVVGKSEVSDPPLIAEIDRVIDAEDPPLLLCTDNIDSAQKFRTRYGDRVIWREKKMLPMHSQRRMTTMEDSVIDLYSLARTCRIIGSRTSSFSWYAAFLGDIEFIQTPTPH